MPCAQCGRQNLGDAGLCNDCATGLEAPPEASREEAAAPASRAGSDFVGRQHEMGQLKIALDDALSGQGRLVMLVGEPGIGKTRTAQELAAIAEAQGVQALWGWCHEGYGGPPYWPWLHPIRSYIRQHESQRLYWEMGPGAADIAEIAPDLRERLPHLGLSPALEDPEQARFRLFDSITTFFKNAARTRPMLLILDDLHWADKPSLLLLEFVAREVATSPLLIVGPTGTWNSPAATPCQRPLGNWFGYLVSSGCCCPAWTETRWDG